MQAGKAGNNRALQKIPLKCRPGSSAGEVSSCGNVSARTINSLLRSSAPNDVVCVQEVWQPTWDAWQRRATQGTAFRSVVAARKHLQSGVLYNSARWRSVLETCLSHRGRMFQLVRLAPVGVGAAEPVVDVLNVNLWHGADATRDLRRMVALLYDGRNTPADVDSSVPRGTYHGPPAARVVLAGDLNTEAPERLDVIEGSATGRVLTRHGHTTRTCCSTDDHPEHWGLAYDHLYSTGKPVGRANGVVGLGQPPNQRGSDHLIVKTAFRW